jgi:MFS family permease
MKSGLLIFSAPARLARVGVSKPRFRGNRGLFVLSSTLVPPTVNALSHAVTSRWSEFKGNTPEERNLYYLSIEIIWAGFATGMVTFNAPFILRLGGGDSLIGIMPALVALLTIVLTIPCAKFLESRSNRKPWIVWSLGAARLVYLFIALVPWLVPAPLQAVSVVALIVLQAAPVALFNAGFLSLIGDVCPPDKRSQFLSTRTFLLAVSVAISAFLSGLWLNAAPFPFNYQALNLAGFLLAQYSTWLVAKVQFPNYVVKPRPAGVARMQINFGVLRESYRANKVFAKLNLAILVGWLGIWGAIPLLTLYFVNTLKFDEAWLGLNNTLAQVGTMIGALFWPRMIDKKGNRWVFLRTLMVYWTYPLLIVLLPLPAPILAFGFAFTLLDPAINVTLFSVLLNIIPEDRRSSYMAGHISLMNVGAMVAPLATVGLAGVIGVPLTLVLCSLIRLIGLIWLWVLPMENKPVPQATSTPAQT